MQSETERALREALNHVRKAKEDIQLIRIGLQKSIDLLIHDECVLTRALATPNQATGGGDGG